MIFIHIPNRNTVFMKILCISQWKLISSELDIPKLLYSCLLTRNCQLLFISVWFKPLQTYEIDNSYYSKDTITLLKYFL